MIMECLRSARLRVTLRPAATPCNTGNPVPARRRSLICVKASARGDLAVSPQPAEGTTVMSSFIVRPLPPEQILSVYPLVRETMPDVDLAAWTAFARRLSGRRRTQAGIMAAYRQGRPFPCGLFCFQVDKALPQGRVLTAEYFVAVDLLDPRPVLTALVAELDALGQRLGCNAVRSVVHGGEQEIAGGLFAAGHAPEASMLLKALAAGGAGHHSHPRSVHH